MTARRIITPDEAMAIELRHPCDPETFADLVFTAIVCGEPPWLDAPTHEGFWWMRRPGSEPTVVSVKFFTVGETRYVHSADTQGNFGTVHVAARWQAIVTPRGEVAK